MSDVEKTVTMVVPRSAALALANGRAVDGAIYFAPQDAAQASLLAEAGDQGDAVVDPHDPTSGFQ